MFLSIFIVGPVFPLGIATSFLITYIERIGTFVAESYTFPYLSAARDYYTFGFAWLFVSLATVTYFVMFKKVKK